MIVASEKITINGHEFIPGTDLPLTVCLVLALVFTGIGVAKHAAKFLVTAVGALTLVVMLAMACLPLEPAPS